MAQTFKDRDGRDWSITVDMPLLRAVRDQLGFNLLDAIEKDPALLADPVRVFDTAYLACREQCEARKLSDEDFGRSFDGTALDDVATAIALAIADWLPPDRGKAVRLALQTVVDAQRTIVAGVTAKLMEAVAPPPASNDAAEPA